MTGPISRSSAATVRPPDSGPENADARTRAKRRTWMDALTKPIRHFALRQIRSLGYEVRHVASPAALAIEPVGTDPVALEYRLSKRGYAVFHIDLDQCRSFHSLGLPLRSECHPFVRAFAAAMALKNRGQVTAAVARTLEGYYEAVQPRSACEMVGLSEADAPGLKGVPPVGYILPWWEKGVVEMTQGRERALEYVGMRYGIKTPAEAGHTFFGPVQPAKLALQVERLRRLLQSVERRGFQPFAQDAPTKVVALRKDGDYRWFVEEGQHRFALGAFLGEQSIPAMVTQVVRREDARLWPQVVNGTFSEKGALDIFDRLFDGRPAPVARSWCGEHIEDRPAFRAVSPAS